MQGDSASGIKFVVQVSQGWGVSHLLINNCVFTFASEFRQNNARALRF